MRAATTRRVQRTAGDGTDDVRSYWWKIAYEKFDSMLLSFHGFISF